MKNSVIWHINRESILVLAGPRALFLQLAHPAVAAGVFAHSDWQRRPLCRLLRTLWLTNQIVFGSEQSAQRALRHIHRRHLPVRGVYFSPHAKEPRFYSAADPELQLWVLATLIESSLYAYRRWIDELSDSVIELYWQEWRQVAARFRIPEQRIPHNYDHFKKYFTGMVQSSVLEVTEEARKIGHALLHTSPPLSPLLTSLTASSLPPALREAYGLPFPAHERAKCHRFDRQIRRLTHLAPPVLRISPFALLARLR